MARFKKEFSDLILGTTGRRWPIVEKSFPTLSVPLLVVDKVGKYVLQRATTDQ
jgi:hypothetical protein